MASMSALKTCSANYSSHVITQANGSFVTAQVVTICKAAAHLSIRMSPACFMPPP